MLKLSDAWWPLALATMAGLSTSLGAIVAVVRKPNASSMAALLGIALGVMATVSCVELVAKNAMSGAGDPFLILAAAMSGALAYYMLEPLFPKMDEHHDHIKKQDDLDDHEAFFQLLQQQQQPQHSSSDTERSSHGASQRKVTTAGAGCYGTTTTLAQGGCGGAGIAAAGGGAGASSTSVLLATATSGGSGGLARKANVERQPSFAAGMAAIAAPGLGGTCTMGGGGSSSSTALQMEGLIALGSGGAAGGAGAGSGGAVAGFGAAATAGSDGALFIGSGSNSASSSSAAAAALATGKGVRGPRGGRMLRLGVLMAVTMTLHNLPEGFAVAFSAFTDFGPIMALAIALHNIPEGVIVAAPIYAATGSRWRAIGVATASGLSEPLGALLSLLLLQPFFTQERLHYLLAFVGGVMLAVCGIELWPEGRNCRNDRYFAGGILGGSLVMGWTLYVEG